MLRLTVLRSAALSAALVALVSSCSATDAVSPATPPLPPGAEALQALAPYGSWWSDVENCSGKRADMARIAWFIVPNEDHFVYRGKSFDGYWWSTHWVVLASPFVDDAAIVRHEMLHDLLNRGDHPAEFFQRRCAGVVVCNEDCRLDDKGR
jgi:hypothetical protein